MLQRGVAGGAAGATRDRHANVLTCATVTRAGARWSRAQLFGARGPRQIPRPCQPDISFDAEKTRKRIR